MHLQENTLMDLDPTRSHKMLPSTLYTSAKFEKAISSDLRGDAFTTNVTDSHMDVRKHGHTDRRTDFGTKSIYSFLLKKKWV